MMLQDRIPSTHDTFQYLQLQYNYFNEAASKGSLPFWMPFVAHGENVAHLFPLQLSPFSPVQLLLGWAGVRVNFLWLFFIGVWFDLFLFQTGIVLLCRKFFKRLETTALVSIILLGGIVWSCQLWWNLHQIYFVPILLYCLHEALDSHNWKWLAGCLVFYFLGANTQITYNIIFTSFAVTVYSFGILPLHRKDIPLLCKNLFRPLPLFVLGLLWGLFAFSFLNVTEGLKSLAIAGRLRDASGGISLETFMTYGGSIGFDKFMDFLFRSPQTHDMTLYAGVVMIPCVIIAVGWSKGKYVRSLLVTATILLLFCAGTTLTKAAYYLFPGFKYFRHIGLTAPMLKLFLVFLAGYGFEHLLDKKDQLKPYLVAIAVYCVLIGSGWAYINNMRVSILPDLLTSNLPLVITLSATCLVSIVAFCVRKLRIVYPLLLLAVVTFDFIVYQYQFQVLSVPVASDGFIRLFNPYGYGFQPSRNKPNNNRFADFTGSPHSWQNADFALYNSIDWTLYTDTLFSPFAVHSNEKPVSELINAAEEYRSRFGESVAYSTLDGLSSPKLRVYKTILKTDSTLQTFGRLLANQYGNNALYTTSSDASFTPRISANPMEDFLVPAKIYVRDFSSNRILIDVETPPDSLSAHEYYLYYADAYHPSWHARVNKKTIPIIKANGAYKAVPIPPGKSTVEFTFFNPLIFFSTCVALLFALGGFSVTLFLFQSWWHDNQMRT